MTRVPSDPRTWASFGHIGVRGFRKVECETPLESVTTAIGFGLAILGAFWIWKLYVQALIGQGDPAAVLGDWRPVATIVAGLLFLAVRLTTDNFYLIDPARQVTYLHFKLGPFRRVQQTQAGVSSRPTADGRRADSVRSAHVGRLLES